MPSFTTVIEADVPINGTLSLVVPGLRQGDVHPGTGRMTIDQIEVPAAEVEFMATYGTEPMVNAYNRGPAIWPQGSEAVLTWDGEIIEQQVADLDARVTVLENLNEWFTSGELAGGNHQLKIGPGMVGRLLVSPLFVGSRAPQPPPILNILDGVGSGAGYPIYTVNLATVLQEESYVVDLNFPFEAGLYVEIPGAERCLISWR